VFKDARIIESGRYDELVARGGFFAELANAQFAIPETTKNSPLPTGERP
jgi:ATP-binding cassette subfamily B protein